VIIFPESTSFKQTAIVLEDSIEHPNFSASRFAFASGFGTMHHGVKAII